MTYSFWDFLTLLGSLGIFIYGMKLMSEGIQRTAGDKLRQILSGMTSTRFTGVLTGFLITILVQSSSATTVMVVSFVNAGLLTLGQSIGVVMGANIGTTITAWIISIFGFKVKIVSIAIVMMGIALPFLFIKKKKLRYFAEFIMGFGILFIGLDFLKSSVPDIKNNPEMLSFLQQYTESGFTSTILFIIIGTVLTIVVQSSSASMAITLVMLAKGWIDLPIAAAMVLGENIGTTITANIAALVGNVHAKRTAIFHFLFNVFGIIWMLAIFGYFLQFIDWQVQQLTGHDISSLTAKAEVSTDAVLALALFHSSFNIINVLLLFPFAKLLEKFVIKIQPSRGKPDERFELRFITTGLLSTPELSIAQARKELQLFGRLVEKMFSNITMLMFRKPKNIEKLFAKIKKREDITDRIELEIANYLTRVSESDLSESSSKKVRRMLRAINDLERIADIIYQMSMNVQRMNEMNAKLPEEVKKELEGMFDNIYAFLKLMNNNLDKDVENISIRMIYEMEEKINHLRDDIQQRHYTRLEQGLYSVQEGIIYLDFVNSCEKIGDHIVNINEAVAGLK